MKNIDFLKEAKAIEKEIISIRRDLHEYPELGFEEYRTNEKIREFLDKENIPYEVVSKTGVCALIEGGKPGKTVALRGDMDGLPLNDRKEV